MARRALLSEAWWQQATIIPDNEREIAKHYTLDRSDLDLIMRQNKASNRLGLACVLATLRYPGRPLADGEVLPAGVLRFLARQIGVDHHEIERYFGAHRRGASIWPCFSTECRCVRLCLRTCGHSQAG